MILKLISEISQRFPKADLSHILNAAAKIQSGSDSYDAGSMSDSDLYVGLKRLSLLDDAFLRIVFNSSSCASGGYYEGTRLKSQLSRGQMEDQLNEWLGSSLHQLTAVKLASRDLAQGDLDSAVSRLYADADKLRGVAPTLYDLVQQAHQTLHE